MSAPAGFSDLLNRKYNIQETSADAAAELARANAANITASTPFENALRGAQTNETNQRAGTLKPLSEASIRSSDAGAQEAGARSGFYGAQSNLAGAQTAAQYSRLGAVPDIALQGAYRTAQQTFAPGGAISTSPTTVQNERSVTDSNVIGGAQFPDPNDPNDPRQFQFHNRGTSMVPDRKYAGGSSDVKPVPAPGQTQTSGTWGSAPNIRQITGITGVPRPTPPPPAYAKGTSKVAAGHKGAGGKHVAPPPARSPMGPLGAPPGMPSPGQMGPAMPGPMAGPPPGLPGLAGMLQAAMGADQVPGQGNKDTVPAMLTPGEAVVNQGGVNHIPGGRATIARANAQGNADKAAGGRPGLNRGMVKKAPGHNVAVHIHLH